jgi:hypothetical protein
MMLKRLSQNSIADEMREEHTQVQIIEFVASTLPDKSIPGGS